MDIHSATLDYCEDAKVWRERHSGLILNLNSPNGPEIWPTADLYVRLRDTIRTHCVDIRALLFAPENSVGVDGARRLIGEYVAHWNMMAHLASFVSNLLRYLERTWIKMCMDVGQRDIHMIGDLHTMIWKEEVLRVGVPGTEETIRTEMDRAMVLLQSQGEGGVESDKELVKRFLESLRALGLAAVLAIR